MVYPGDGGNLLGMTYVDNLAEGVLLAATVPAAAGNVYHVTDGEEVTCRELLEALAAELGLAPPRRSVPLPLVMAVAALLEWGARAARSATPAADHALRREAGRVRLPLRHREGAARAGLPPRRRLRGGRSRGSGRDWRARA